ncbi:MAG: HEAT repeat domain-containing protein, partial [Dictyoglomus sp.]
MRESIDIGILTTDKSLNITYWNSWLEKKTGLLSEEVLGKNLLELFPELEKHKIKNIFFEVLEFRTVRILSPKIHKYLIPIKLSSPSKYFENMQQLVIISPLESDKDILGLIITIEDATKVLEEEYELKEKLKDSNEKVRIEALRKLAEKDKREVIEALSDESWRVRRIAVEELQKATKDMVIDLLKKMKEEHHDLNVLNSIIKVISAIPKIDIVDTLAEMLKDEDPDLRIYTIQILETQKDS